MFTHNQEKNGVEAWCMFSYMTPVYHSMQEVFASLNHRTTYHWGAPQTYESVMWIDDLTTTFSILLSTGQLKKDANMVGKINMTTSRMSSTIYEWAIQLTEIWEGLQAVIPATFSK
jgi:hypothetical protein